MYENYNSIVFLLQIWDRLLKYELVLFRNFALCWFMGKYFHILHMRLPGQYLLKNRLVFRSKCVLDTRSMANLGLGRDGLLLLSCEFNHHVVKFKYDIRSAFRCNSKWESFQRENLRIWLSWWFFDLTTSLLWKLVFYLNTLSAAGL